MENDQVEAEFCGHISWPKQTQDIPITHDEDLSLATTTSTESEPDEPRNPWMQAVWDQASSKELSVPYKYQNVTALIVHWAKYLDEDLNCESEVGYMTISTQSKVHALMTTSQRTSTSFSKSVSSSSPAS